METTTGDSSRFPDNIPVMSVLAGHCLCGTVTIAVAAEHDPRVGACHCRMRQRWSGELFLGFTAEASAVTFTGEVARYCSSSFAERAFLPALRLA